MIIDRIKMVKAMEYIARQINDEDVFEEWLMDGVADEDIAYGDFTIKDTDEELVEMEYYIRDEEFAELMGTFLHVMSRAKKSGGLFCNGIVSK